MRNRYKYNGKELFEELQWLNYGARFYDAAVGRWWGRDPKAEKYYALTPYSYVGGNPVRLVDPDGRDIGWVVTGSGDVVWDDRVKSQSQAEQLYGPGAQYKGEDKYFVDNSGIVNVHEELGAIVVTPEEQQIENIEVSPYLVSGTSWGGVIAQAANLTAKQSIVKTSEQASKTLQLGAADLKVLGSIKKVGTGINFLGSILSISINLYNYENNPTMENLGRLGVSIGTVGVGFIPEVGPFLSFLISSYDSSGGFDKFYKWLNRFDKKENKK